MNYGECLGDDQAPVNEAKVPLFVAYYRRALPRFLKIRELIETGAIGEVRSVTVNYFRKPLKLDPGTNELPWRVKRALAGGGLLLDVGSHTLDILDFLLGQIREVKGLANNQAHQYAVEDIVTGGFVFESGAHGMGTWCFSAYDNCDLNEIVGSKGKLSFSTFGSDPVVLTTERGPVEFPCENPLHIQQPLIQTIVNELNGTGTCPSHGDSAARTSWVMDQLIKDYYTK